jgi:hypothetical protein
LQRMHANTERVNAHRPKRLPCRVMLCTIFLPPVSRLPGVSPVALA